MPKPLLRALAMFLACIVCRAQTPNEVRMVLEPFPEGRWYMSLAGECGRVDPETKLYDEDYIGLYRSECWGGVGEEEAEATMSLMRNAGKTDYRVRIVTDRGRGDLYKIRFRQALYRVALNGDYRVDP